MDARTRPTPRNSALVVTTVLQGDAPWLLRWYREVRHGFVGGTGRCTTDNKVAQGGAPLLFSWYREVRHGYCGGIGTSALVFKMALGGASWLLLKVVQLYLDVPWFLR